MLIDMGHSLSCTAGWNSNLAKCGREAGLCVFVNKNSCHHDIVPSGTMATTVEALIDPVFLDSGASLMAVKGAMTGLCLIV
jgi:hypothetical protein